METYQKTTLWKNAFESKSDGQDDYRNLLATAYCDFRSRVVLLLQQIQWELPSLTLHDISHVDSLWDVASEIAGPEYDLTPAEAFVLGGAFLLHDAAHCRAAFPDGLKQLQETAEWKDATAQLGFSPDTLSEGSESFQAVLFDTLRLLHPKQARQLPFAHWPTEEKETSYHLMPHDALREAYGHIIGEIAESHWWHPHELEPLARRTITAPVCLAPAKWTVDILKVAVLLRTADASQIDARRAPRLLMLINQPQGFSKEHWQFQARLNQPSCDRDRNELIFSGNPFPQEEMSAWWLAFDAACLANKELGSADMLLRDNQRGRLAARSVSGSHSPEIFSRHVPTDGWYPVDTTIKVTEIKTIVERFGGEKLYGDNPAAALRELLQNAVDAVHACRTLGGLGSNEGEIEIALESTHGGHWLHIVDTGIGMSRYVLTEVLLDFGCSLWRSAEVRGEWSGLLASDFEAIGQFGIGFFSVFMLGEKVRVISRRYETKEGEAPQWLLEFTNGARKRPTLRVPSGTERLKRHGTQVSVLIREETLKELCPEQSNRLKNSSRISFAQACARLGPALDIDLFVRNSGEKRQQVIRANDWLMLSPLDLLQRIAPGHFINAASEKFGIWSHFSELRNHAGSVIGRCAVQPLAYAGPGFGIGVVKGILAGTIPGVAGILISKPQRDLARKESIPDVLLHEIQNWAENQKELLIENGKLKEKDSELLAKFGSSHTGLILGALGGQPISYEKLIEFLRNTDIAIVHDGDVSYDDNDDVLQKDFGDFEPEEFLLELASGRLPDWVNQIDDDTVTRNSWSLEAALDSALATAWGQVDWDIGEVPVGEVNGTDIMRICRIPMRQNELEDEIP